MVELRTRNMCLCVCVLNALILIFIEQSVFELNRTIAVLEMGEMDDGVSSLYGYFSL